MDEGLDMTKKFIKLKREGHSYRTNDLYIRASEIVCVYVDNISNEVAFKLRLESDTYSEVYNDRDEAILRCLQVIDYLNNSD